MTHVRCMLFVVVLATIPACQRHPDNAMAVKVASAVVETREGPDERELSTPTQVVMLGTGTPIPDAHRAGPSVAVIHKGQAYLFDVGAGAVRNATFARYRFDIPSLYPSQICCVFITHLHSDHTMDYSELVYTLWWRRSLQLRAFGPQGLREMTAGIQHMMAPDRRIRMSGVQPVANPDGYDVDVSEIEDGFVYDHDGIRIEAFEVDHGDIKPAFAYRITTPDKSIVISGDTAASEKLQRMATGVDILIHEVISDSGLARNSEGFQAYHRQTHTPASELGRLASAARPGLLVLYHGLYYGVPENTVIEEVRAAYDGPVLLAKDLDRY